MSCGPTSDSLAYRRLPTTGAGAAVTSAHTLLWPPGILCAPQRPASAELSVAAEGAPQSRLASGPRTLTPACLVHAPGIHRPGSHHRRSQRGWMRWSSSAHRNARLATSPTRPPSRRPGPTANRRKSRCPSTWRRSSRWPGARSCWTRHASACWCAATWCRRAPRPAVASFARPGRRERTSLRGHYELALDLDSDHRFPAAFAKAALAT